MTAAGTDAALASSAFRCYTLEMLNLQYAPGLVAAVETEVYEALRREITSLHLAPGQRLYLAEIAERYNVSATPIRVAVHRLERDGLVVTRVRRGSVVAPLALPEFERIQAHRMGLEALLASRGARRCGAADIREMRARLAVVDRAAADRDWEAHLRAQWSVRDVCYGLAEAPHLTDDLAEQRSRVERYVRFLSLNADAVKKSRGYEIQLITACRARDGEAAARSACAAQYWALEQFPALAPGAPSDGSGQNGRPGDDIS